MAHRKRGWQDLTSAQRWAVVAGGAVQVALQAAALRDLRHRPATELRGSRRWWVAASFLNYLGPLAYFAVGRRGQRR
jgi:hypothetical protein